MLKDVPKRTISLADLHVKALKYCGGKFVDHNPGVNIGTEYANLKRNVYDLSTVLNEISMTEARWTIFLQA
eukprot:12428226-Karenia_brevis.AAC.1